MGLSIQQHPSPHMLCFAVTNGRVVSYTTTGQTPELHPTAWRPRGYKHLPFTFLGFVPAPYWTVPGMRRTSTPFSWAPEGQRPLLPGTRCAAGPVSTTMGLGCWAPLLPSPASRWARLPPTRDQDTEKDGRIVTCGLNAARNPKPTEHACLAAQTLLRHVAKTVLVANHTDSTAHLILQIRPSVSML